MARLRCRPVRGLSALAALTALAALRPLAAVAEPVLTPFVEELRAIGCVVTEQNEPDFSRRSALSDEEQSEAASALALDGLLLLTAEPFSVALVPALCSGAGAPEAVLVAALRANGCAMTEDEGRRILPPLGLAEETVRALAPRLETAGVLVLEGRDARLSPAACTGVEGPLPSPRGALLRAAAADPACRLFAAEAAALLVAEGLPEVATPALIESLTGGAPVLTFPPALCAAGAGGADAFGRLLLAAMQSLAPECRLRVAAREDLDRIVTLLLAQIAAGAEAPPGWPGASADGGALHADIVLALQALREGGVADWDAARGEMALRDCP